MLKRLPILIIFGFIGFGLLTYLSYTEKTFKQLEIDYKNAIFVAYNVDDFSQGTAFKLEYEGEQFYLTNAHVCDTSKSLFLNNSKALILTDVVKVDFSTDLCLLKAKPFVDDSEIPTLKLASDLTSFGLIYTMGFPLGNFMLQDGLGLLERNAYLTFDYFIITYQTYIDRAMRVGGIDTLQDYWNFQCTKLGKNFTPTIKIDKNQTKVEYECLGKFKLILTNFNTKGGASGSPVMNSQGKLIGVINSSYNYIDLGNFITLKSVKGFLQNLDSELN
jgi:hypothetical protein